MDSIITNKNNKFKSVFVSLNFLLPLVKEDMSKNALISMLIKKSSGEKELARRLAELYSAKLETGVEKIGNYYNIQVVLEVLNEQYIKEDLKKAIEFLVKTITFPMNKNAFDESLVEREKTNLKQRIEEEKDDKRQYALKRAEENFFEGTNYGYPTYGTVEDLEKIDAQGLGTYYISIMEQAKLVVIVSGNVVDENMIAEKIKEKLVEVGIGKNEVQVIEEFPMFDDRSVSEYVEEEELNQSIVVLGLKVGKHKKEDMYKIALFDKVLGGTPSSKLFQNVREKNSLAYFAKSLYNRQKEVIYMFAGIAPEKYLKAKEIMIAQIDEIKNNLSEEEFVAARDYLISNYKNYEDSKFESGRILFTNELYFDKLVRPEAMEKELEKVTIEEVRQVADSVKLVKIFLLGGSK